MEEMLDIDALTALGHPGRLAVFRLLARRAPHGVRPSEIAHALDLKPNTLSVYVTALTRAGLLTSWREGRSVFYGVALDRVGALIDFLVNDCCHGRPDVCEPLAARALERLPQSAEVAHAHTILFVCSANAARSQFAEAILNRDGGARFRAFSAGTRPGPSLSADAAAVLTARGHDLAGLAPKPVAAFAAPGAAPIDILITVCDEAANRERPRLPGLPLTAHWSVASPGAAPGDRAAAFGAAYDTIKARLDRLIALPIAALGPARLQAELDAIGTPST